MVSGVLGGFGAYLSIDPTVVRIIFVLLLLATGIFPGVFLYLLAVYFIPEGTTITPSHPVEDDAPAI